MHAMPPPVPRPLLRYLAPAVLVSLTLAVNAALWSPLDTDPGLSPFALTVSDFAALDRGGPIETTMALLGLASLALPAGARLRRVPVRGLPTVLLAVWGLGLVLAAVVPTDPLATELSGAAQVHRYASVAAFAALPAAGLLLARRFGTGPAADRTTARRLRFLSYAALAGAVLMACSAGPGDRALIGLAERLLLGCEVALLAVLTLRVQRYPAPAPRRTGVARPARRTPAR
ncbi:hypothetical protein GCM10009801_67740 [Streptomyces albiaxialis]|uniref:DUF998 domain-containing protein n=1 Tax=Streptomyces albiaxialis TaxID=329523 RepID=A0ABN2WRI1_9ACTN